MEVASASAVQPDIELAPTHASVPGQQELSTNQPDEIVTVLEDESMRPLVSGDSDNAGTLLRGCSKVDYVDAEGKITHTSLDVVHKATTKHLNEGACFSCFGLTLKKTVGCGLSCCVALAMIIVLMTTTLVVKQRTVRRYYIGIDDITWDYAPGSINQCTGEAYNYMDRKYTQSGEKRIGSRYAKAAFREYTDGTFLVAKPREPQWEHLGLLGPALHAEVGDVVEVIVRNNARFPFSFATQGVGVNKANEGASYRRGISTSLFDLTDDALPPLSLGVRDCGTPVTFLASELQTTSLHTARTVPVAGAPQMSASVNPRECAVNHHVLPSESRLYTFLVDDDAGPGPSDGSSVMHLYTSHVGGHTVSPRDGGTDGFASDQNAGLFGPLIITRRGAANLDGRPSDVDRELVVVMGVQDENDSPYLRKNIWDNLVQPVVDSDRPPGHVPFGPTGKPRTLMALYQRATRGVDKLTYNDAAALITSANNAHTYVGSVRGINIHVNFDAAHFNPRWYDAANGGTGTALEVMEAMWIDAVDVNDPAFMESNAMHSVNGYLYCAQPGLSMMTGERVRWYTASVGGTDAIHTPHWHGNTILYAGGRGDQFELLASSTAVADMTPENPGIWQLHCHVNDHKKAGMLSLYTVQTPSGGTAPSAECSDLGGMTRTYYIAAEEVEWDYYNASDAASGIDRCAPGVPLSQQPALHSKYLRRALERNGIDRIGTTFTKARYVQYTDSTFTQTVTQPAWSGILGPTLRAKVGDTIRVVARNNLPFPVSWHPHGVRYQKGAEGAPYNDGTSGADKADDSIAPGTTHEYVWCVPESAGPGPEDSSSVVWLYHDHVHEINGTNAGLVGPIVIARSDAAGQDAVPTDVAHEFVLLFAATNENGALYAERNIAERLPLFGGNNASLSNATRSRLTYELRKYDPFFKDAMRKRSINGKMQCALPGLQWAVGERVRLHLISVGDEELHAPTLGAHVFTYLGRREPAIGLMASSMKSVDFTAVGAGPLLLSAGSRTGSSRGMLALATASGVAPAAPPSARTYYISADEVLWDFMPSGRNMCGDDGGASVGRARADTLHAEAQRAGGVQGGATAGYNGMEDNGQESEFSLYTNAHANAHRIGTQYVMALFREYEDSTFTSLRHGFKSRANEASVHLGLQGPVLRALPGEAVTVVLHNRLRYACNFVVQGMRPANGIADERPLAPGETRTLVFIVDVSNAPLNQTSVAFAYKSDYNAAVAGLAAHAVGGPTAPPILLGDFADANVGLFGAMIVTRSLADAHSADLAPTSVQREFVLFMGTLDQNLSPYLGQNIAQFTASPEYVDRSHPDFKESNRMHAINGRVYCNLDGLDVMFGRTARWYVFALGGDDAFASPRWHGTALIAHGSRMASLLVQPGASAIADLVHNNVGTWLLQDQTTDHAYAGAAAIFTVQRKIAALCELAFWMKC